jgi:type I restriction enzyme R subunit
MRNHVRRLLKKYDCPPKQARHALEIVLRQTELMRENIVYEKSMEDRFKNPINTSDSMVAEVFIGLKNNL